MSRVRATTPVPFLIGECQCPGTPHGEPGTALGVPIPAGDVALFRPALTLDGSLEIAALLTNSDLMDDDTRFIARLGKACLLDGLVWWNLQGENGATLPLSRTFLESGALTWEGTMEHLANKAADLYGEEALRPLARAVASVGKDSGSSGSGPTMLPTSPTQRGSSRPRTRSSRSTTATTPRARSR